MSELVSLTYGWVPLELDVEFKILDYGGALDVEPTEVRVSESGYGQKRRDIVLPPEIADPLVEWLNKQGLLDGAQIETPPGTFERVP